MRKIQLPNYVAFAITAIVVCLLFKGWDSIFSFLGILIAAVAPLFIGMAVAYVVSIPTAFFQRHFFPNSTSRVIAGLRKPISLVLAVVIALAIVILSTSVLIPALIETVTVVQVNGQSFVEDVISQPFFSPVREPVHNFLASDFMQDLRSMDIAGIVQTVFGGNISNVTTHMLTVASMVMTGFFGLLFSFILLTDTTHVGDKVMSVLSEYLGFERTQRFAMVLGVADASFHNFIVRQFIEAAILGSVGTIVLLACGFEYAFGVGMLVFLLALIPIVGYPVGLFLGAFMVAIFNVWVALLFILCVAAAQVLEATFVLPHVGDPRTVLPPVWITVGVTIGGGVAGFLGMLVAIPITSTIIQLIKMGIRQRQAQVSRMTDDQTANEAAEQVVDKVADQALGQ